MPKGRHRKQQLTQLPAGARTMTGKSRTASKAQTYQRILPVAVEQQHSNAEGGHRRANAASPYVFPAWADYLMSLLGYPGSTHTAREKQKERELDIVVGKWDPATKAVYLDVTPSSNDEIRNVEGSDEATERQSAAMRYLWDSGFFGKGTLSRSEPTWHRRQVNAIRVRRERERGGKGEHDAERRGEGIHELTSFTVQYLHPKN